MTWADATGPDTSGTGRNTQANPSGNWQFSDRTDVSELVFKPCGEDRNFNINTELRVYKGTSDAAKTSFMAFDSTDGSVRTTYHFAWKKCPG
ncbi:DUF4360 domain-containing protein [Actinomadura citrea]|uniref:DUF4360 domain-containing protein n=1 Tax=Actinomadura citrea TaxID=46158 RepID=UPI002E29DD36|nr:DUF4360 domain-containing protein [Actinomadura citrea]